MQREDVVRIGGNPVAFLERRRYGSIISLCIKMNQMIITFLCQDKTSVFVGKGMWVGFVRPAHFLLNALTVFSSSISLGISKLLQSMETGRAGVTISTTGSFVEVLILVTIAILGFLVGQLVGVAVASCSWQNLSSLLSAWCWYHFC